MPSTLRLSLLVGVCYLVVGTKEFKDEELLSTELLPLIQSMQYLKARYVHFSDPSQFFFESIRRDLILETHTLFNDCQGLANETAEKQSPSAFQLCGEFRNALDAMRQSDPSKRNLSVKELLTAAVATYNKQNNIRKYRIESNRKKMILNLLRTPERFSMILSAHYDKHRHSCSGAIWSAVPRSPLLP